MRIVALHTDFRIYWPSRLAALNIALNSRGDTLDIIEIAGDGSPYAFSQKSTNSDLNWHILFPERKPEDLSGSEIKTKLFLLLKEIQPDVIIAGAIAFASGALAVAWGQKTGCRVIAFDDTKINAAPRNKVIEFVKKSVYNGVDAMLYPAMDWVKTGQYWNFKPEELFFGLDVVDNDFWAKPMDLSYPEWGDFFVAVGRQIPKKNYLTIVQAYCKYANHIEKDPFKLVLIGNGPEHDSIANYVKKSNHRDTIILLPFLSQNELPCIYQHAKALCCASDCNETWGLVINEAMAGGCPIIASTQCGATNTLVHNGINGFTFSFEDSDLLSEHMRSIHNHTPEEHLSMKFASKSIISEWGLNRFVNGSCNAIDHVTSHSKRRTSLVDRAIIKLWKGRYRPI